MYHTYNEDLLGEALRDLVGVLNSPRQDAFLLREAGILLDRALFPLLLRIGAGPMSVTDLAEQVGRDHSTVSRQIAKLTALGLVARGRAAADQRVREAAITPAGSGAVAAITQARRRVLTRLLAEWTPEDRQALALLNRRLADAMIAARQAPGSWKPNS